MLGEQFWRISTSERIYPRSKVWWIDVQRACHSHRNENQRAMLTCSKWLMFALELKRSHPTLTSTYVFHVPKGIKKTRVDIINYPKSMACHGLVDHFNGPVVNFTAYDVISWNSSNIKKLKEGKAGTALNGALNPLLPPIWHENRND